MRIETKPEPVDASEIRRYVFEQHVDGWLMRIEHAPVGTEDYYEAYAENVEAYEVQEITTSLGVESIIIDTESGTC